MIANSAHRSSTSNSEPLLPTLNLPTFSQEREEISEDQTNVAATFTIDATLESVLDEPDAPVQ